MELAPFQGGSREVPISVCQARPCGLDPDPRLQSSTRLEVLVY